MQELSQKRKEDILESHRVELPQEERVDSSVDVSSNPTEFTAHIGEPLPAGLPVATSQMVIEALKTVQDPELMLSIYDLGLIYNVDIRSDGDVFIEMTLTAPTCPIAGEMPKMAALAVSKLEGVGRVEVKLVWDPPWTLDKMSDELKIALGI